MLDRIGRFCRTVAMPSAVSVYGQNSGRSLLSPSSAN